MLKAFAKTLMAAGAVIFLVGDRALRAIWNVPFVTAEAIGIGGGVGVMLLGLALQSRSSSKEGAFDEEAIKPGDLKS